MIYKRKGQHPLLFSHLCATLSQADKTHDNHVKSQQHRGVKTPDWRNYGKSKGIL